MEGLVGGIILCFLLGTSTIFIAFYTLTVSTEIIRNELFRIVASGILSVISTFVFMLQLMLYIQYALILSLIIVLFSFYYLSKPSAPKNLVLLLRQKILSSSHPLAFGIILTVINFAIVFLLTAAFFP